MIITTHVLHRKFIYKFRPHFLQLINTFNFQPFTHFSSLSLHSLTHSLTLSLFYHSSSFLHNFLTLSHLHHRCLYPHSLFCDPHLAAYLTLFCHWRREKRKRREGERRERGRGKGEGNEVNFLTHSYTLNTIFIKR